VRASPLLLTDANWEAEGEDIGKGTKYRLGTPSK